MAHETFDQGISDDEAPLRHQVLPVALSAESLVELLQKHLAVQRTEAFRAALPGDRIVGAGGGGDPSALCEPVDRLLAAFDSTPGTEPEDRLVAVFGHRLPPAHVTPHRCPIQPQSPGDPEQ